MQLLQIGLPQNHKILSSFNDKIKNSGDSDNSILSRKIDVFCYFAEVLQVKILSFINPNFHYTSPTINNFIKNC